MSDIAEKSARRRILRNAAMVAVVLPAVLAACAPQPAPAPPPPPRPPQPVAAPAPLPPPPPAPVIRGERG
jgi:hypothetical protein